jgi:hypothetical protein
LNDLFEDPNPTSLDAMSSLIVDLEPPKLDIEFVSAAQLITEQLVLGGEGMCPSSFAMANITRFAYCYRSSNQPISLQSQPWLRLTIARDILQQNKVSAWPV